MEPMSYRHSHQLNGLAVHFTSLVPPTVEDEEVGANKHGRLEKPWCRVAHGRDSRRDGWEDGLVV